MNFPHSLRSSTLDERKNFYSKEFFKHPFRKYIPKNTAFAVILGRRTNVFLQKYKADAKDLIYLDDTRTDSDLKKDLLEFAPESFFFSRTICDSPHHYYSCKTCQTNPEKCKHFQSQMIMIDLDPENLQKNKEADIFSLNSFEKIKKETLRLYEWLPFTKKQIIFSGRGFHIHILDKDTLEWNRRWRTQLARQITALGFHHDEWVCTGEYDQARVPYSLNGITNRVAIPLSKKELEGFDLINDKKSKPSA